MRNLLLRRSVCLILAFCGCLLAGAVFAKGETAAADKLGWRVGPQSYSFRKFTFFEAVDKTAAMGMKFIEAFPKQKVSAESDATMDFAMDAATRKAVQDKLGAAGVKLVNYGVITPMDEAGWRQLFEFAQSMGIETIVSEPPPADMALVDKLCEEFKIAVAIHNHPSPSPYWNPEAVLKAVEGCGKRIGACADTGHWVRSGLDPLECLKKLQGRVISLHLKDLNTRVPAGIESFQAFKKDKKRAPLPHDVPWGTGACNVFGCLAELKRQNFRGMFAVEYEQNWDNSMPEIEESADAFYLFAQALDEGGYKPLFKEDLSDAIFPEEAWAVKDGVLGFAKEGNIKDADIWTKERYGDFALDLEFKCAANTNSGVFLRTGDIKQWRNTAIEVQILQKWLEDKPRENCGGVFDCAGPSKNMVKPAGEWNHFTILAKANRITVVLNGELVLNMHLDLWTEAHKNPDGSPNKFENAYKDMPRTGNVGLQYHGHPIWFRNLKIKPL